MKSRLKVLYVPNEDGDFRQLGFRRPFANLIDAGLLGSVSVFSLQLRIRRGGDPEGHRQDLIDRVAEFKPDLILMQHVGSTGLRAKHFRAMRSKSEFILIYHEADPYSPFLHPLPRPAQVAGRYSDVVATVGTGWFRENFERSGARDVRWASHVFEPERYRFRPVDQSPARVHDIVMIANRNTPRFRGLPNWRDRIRFVEYMQDRFADRFAIFGRGWSGPSALGPVDFSQQDEAIRSGWVSANWDHYANEPHYFSNRLPVSLSAGSIHATGYHHGYADIFGADTSSFLKLGNSHRGLADEIEGFLERTTGEERIRIGQLAQTYAFQRFRQDNQLVEFLNYGHKRVDADAASASWDIEAAPIDEI